MCKNNAISPNVVKFDIGTWQHSIFFSIFFFGNILFWKETVTGPVWKLYLASIKSSLYQQIRSKPRFNSIRRNWWDLLECGWKRHIFLGIEKNDNASMRIIFTFIFYRSWPEKLILSLPTSRSYLYQHLVIIHKRNCRSRKNVEHHLHLRGQLGGLL